MNMAKFSAFLLTKINGASGAKQDSLGNYFPKLLQSFKQSDLSGFSSLAALDASLVES